MVLILTMGTQIQVADELMGKELGSSEICLLGRSFVVEISLSMSLISLGNLSFLLRVTPILTSLVGYLVVIETLCQ